MPWHEYRDHFLTAERIDAGVAFWTEHRGRRRQGREETPASRRT